MNGHADELSEYSIAVIIPAFQVREQIGQVLSTLPAFIRTIIVVDDGSTDGTALVVAEHAKSDPRVALVQHGRNRGVGAASKSGLERALELGAQVVVKVDGDGQMAPERIRDLVEPLLMGRADFCKGNRFFSSYSIRSMPLVRRLGNLALSFLVKAATGYWNSFDPTNGFLAIHRDALRDLPLERLDDSYFFEISLLGELYFLRAVLHQVAMPAQYGNERSSLSIGKTLLTFPPKLLRQALRRLALRYFVYDFSLASLYLATGAPLLFFGLVFGGLNWFRYSELAVLAPTGTIMLATLSVILGFQLLLSAVGVDLQSVPKDPIAKPLTRRPDH